MHEKTEKNPTGAGAGIGWRKNTQNSDIRDAMKAKGMKQETLAEIIGMSLSRTNQMLKRELPWNIREALFETIRRYDPETNPKAL